MLNSLVFIAALAAPADEPIVVTGARQPVAQAEAPVSSTLLEEEALEALSLPAGVDLLRLVPGVSVAQSGPRGSQAQVRIRGAEANHTLLFVDGIRFNDPAAGNEARFELLATDLLSRVEIVRGPQSALWGSEALGGVIAVQTADPFARQGLAALTEYGTFANIRAAAQAAIRTGDVGLSATAAYLSSEGIDSFGSGGERDGFDHRSLGLRAAWRPAEGREFGVSAFYVAGNSEYDGNDPATFLRADTLDETENRIAAVRGWGRLESGGWTVSAEASLLDSANRNRLADAPLNRTGGRRATAGAQLSRSLGGHRLTAAVHHETEDFRARDQAYFGGTDQDRARRLTALVGEWHARWSGAISTDVAVRYDSFSAFADATTARAALLVRPAAGWTLHGAYGEGIAQPTFYDLYGFFPAFFTGNPDLRPERSRGFEVGLRRQSGRANVGATLFAGRLEDEIVDVFAGGTSTTRNVDGKSRRRGLELFADWRFSAALAVSANYTYLKADERRNVGDAAIREVRRPKHSANVTAFGETGRLTYSASLAYVGARTDTDFDIFQTVRLGAYALASARIGWRLTDGLEAYARLENALDEEYQDVAGYATAGRTVHAGLRLRFGS
ncbi:MAG TPA: TonB-dependent receptor [Allosphingosinicella sp.]|jgi:vitamin B12 transporter